MRHKLIFLAMLMVVASNSQAGDIAFGTLKGVKVYDFSNSKITRIYFNTDATNTTSACNFIGVITHSQHDEATVQRMVGVALAAYVSGKKVRAYSATSGGCEVDLIGIQDAYF